MKNTEMILKTMQETLNNNEECQRLMTVLAAKAESLGFTLDQWNGFKQDLFDNIFYSMVLEHKDLRDLVAIDAYNLLREDN